MTPASQHRLQLAQQLAAACPPALHRTIALTGSAARGFATDDSDLEVNFWVDALPSVADRTTWLASAGVEAINVAPQPRPDDSYWISGEYHGVPLEAGWQTITAMQNTVDLLLSSTVTDHKTLRLADLILSAVHLRGDVSPLYEWQRQLQAYPDDLAARLIDAALRNDVQTVDDLLRLLFAVNCRWEINWKYAHLVADELPVKPLNFAERLLQSRQDRAEFEHLRDEVVKLTNIV